MRGAAVRPAFALVPLWLRSVAALRSDILHAVLDDGQVAHDRFLESLGGIGPLAPGVLRGWRQVERWAGSFMQRQQADRAAGPTRPDDETVEVKLPWEFATESDVRPLAHCSDAFGLARASSTKVNIRDAPDANLQEALRIFCAAGLGKLTEFYVDHAFRKNFDRLADKDGWLNQAYVTYMGAKQPHDNIGAEEDLLVQSVHHFSTRPVVVANFGKRIPKRWTPERYPNLVLMHARSAETAGTLKSGFAPSFNFNKFTAMLFGKVKAGMVLDADQFANHGLDSLLQKASEETNKDYPYPIMPVHWMSRDPEDDDMKDYPYSYAWRFVNKAGPKQSVRWGHAHPTFGHHALPWLATWTSFVLAPEKTEAPQWLTDQGWIEDEDLLNVALWASNATKQWCKYDIPSPNDFGKYLAQANEKTLFHDSKYFPKGIPFVFVTAHDAKKPNESYFWLQQLWNEGGQHKAILYDGQWFDSQEALSKYDPSLKCMV